MTALHHEHEDGDSISSIDVQPTARQEAAALADNQIRDVKARLLKLETGR